MMLVIALGGNALLRRDQLLTEKNQLDNIKLAAAQIAQLAYDYQLVITHGNGPQIGLLAAQNAADPRYKPYPLDLLGAETDGMLGYLLEQELANQLSPERVVATLLTRVEVSADDSAFLTPDKPIGTIYSQADAEKLAQEKGWTISADGQGFRRVVASPKPQKILGIDSILWLLQHHVIVIAAGGGGIPVIVSADGHSREGISAVIDKDRCSALLAEKIAANFLVIVTDVKAVFVDWGTSSQRAIRRISPTDLSELSFAEGSMGPKVEAACQFVNATGRPAIICSLDDIIASVQDRAGTWVCRDCNTPVYDETIF
jgi:carbamate kinase